MIHELNIASIDFQKGDGLIPAIVQDAETFQVLMLGYMNEEAVKLTVKEGKAHFFSRKRQSLWKKGETSGAELIVSQLFLDCDGDTLLVRATPKGPTCHTGEISCFKGDDLQDVRFLGALSRIISERSKEASDTSYTASLLKKGTKRISQKVGEEGVEVALAAMSGDKEELTNESSDLLFHLLVLLQDQGVSLEQVGERLFQRNRSVAE